MSALSGGMCCVITERLPPTRTYAKRSIAWVSNGSGFVLHKRISDTGEITEEMIPAHGKLTIKLQHAKGYGCKCEIDTYAVAETESDHVGCRAFMLRNLTDPEQGDPYLTHVGGVNICRCLAGQCKVDNCKHRDACELLIELGAFDDTTPFAAKQETSDERYARRMRELAEPCPF